MMQDARSSNTGKTEGAKQRLTLEGVRVLELSPIVAGPSGGLMLGDLGAEVIKAERDGKSSPQHACRPSHPRRRILRGRDPCACPRCRKCCSPKAGS